jgi:hypothetical protein
VSDTTTPPSEWDVTARAATPTVPESRGWFRDFLQFAWEEKWWWIVPSVLMFGLLGYLLMVAQGGAVAPFFYALF